MSTASGVGYGRSKIRDLRDHERRNLSNDGDPRYPTPASSRSRRRLIHAVVKSHAVLLPVRRSFTAAFASLSATNRRSDASVHGHRTASGSRHRTPVRFGRRTRVDCHEVRSWSHLYSSDERNVRRAGDAGQRLFDADSISPFTCRSSTVTDHTPVGSVNTLEPYFENVAITLVCGPTAEPCLRTVRHGAHPRSHPQFLRSLRKRPSASIRLNIVASEEGTVAEIKNRDTVSKYTETCILQTLTVRVQ